MSALHKDLPASIPLSGGIFVSSLPVPGLLSGVNILATSFLLGVFLNASPADAQYIYPDLPRQFVQSAVPVAVTPEGEKALLNDFSYREPDAKLELSAENLRSAEALSHYSQAMAWEDLAESEKALEEYLQVLELDPGFSELAIRLAFEFVRRGEISRGLEILKDAAKASPKEPLLYLNLASIYSRNLNKNELAIRYAREALKVSPENPLVYQTLYEVYLASGQAASAERVLEQASKLKSEDPDFWLRLGDLYARILIKEDGSTAPDKLAKVNAIFNKVLKNAGDDSLTLNRVADYFVFSQQIKDAIPIYVHILELRNNVSAPLLSNVREKLARSFLVSGQRAEAIAVLEEMLRGNPLKYESYEFLGQLYEENGNLEKALANYEQSLLLSPGQPVNHLRVSDLQLRLQQTDRAVNTLKEARSRFPDIPLFSYSLAVAYSQSKQHELAIQLFEETLIESRNVQDEVVNGNFYFNYGAAAEQAGLHSKAAILFKKSIELDPGNAAPALNYLGYMWIERGERLTEAQALIERALDIDPNNGSYLDSLGWLYFKQGKYEAALKELLHAVENLEKEDAIVFEHIGDTYERLGNGSQALFYWSKSSVLDPDNNEIAAKVEAAREKMTSNAPASP